MKTSVLTLIFISFFSFSSFSQENDNLLKSSDSFLLELIQNEDTIQLQEQKLENQFNQHKKVYAALLCITLGPFGMHRLYLGTTPEVAAAYSATLGGIGVLPVIDLFAIIFTKDLSQFRNNNRVMMWRK